MAEKIRQGIMAAQEDITKEKEKAEGEEVSEQEVFLKLFSIIEECFQTCSYHWISFQLVVSSITNRCYRSYI